MAYLLTGHKAYSGPVTAAERRLTPGHHAHAKVVVPCRQEIGHSLLRDQKESVGKYYITLRSFGDGQKSPLMWFNLNSVPLNKAAGHTSVCDTTVQMKYGAVKLSTAEAELSV